MTAGVLLAAVLAAPAATQSTPAVTQYDQCGEDDIACQELWYWLEETLFLYEEGVLSLVGEGAGPCFKADIAAWHAEVAANCGEDAACTETAYRERLASLYGERQRLETTAIASCLAGTCRRLSARAA
jgi:hypothetical protein